MEFKKAIKRIVALGTGASMVGATLFGAMAADLANYPDQYIQDGKFTGVLVVGDQAAAEDVIGVSDIAVSLQYAATKPVSVSGGSVVSAEGEAWLVQKGSTNVMEMSEYLETGQSANEEAIATITGQSYIDDAELPGLLASGTASNSKGDAPYNQRMYFEDTTTGKVQLLEDRDSVTTDFLYFQSGQQIARYELEFTASLESDVDDSTGSADTTGDYLTDIEDTEITMLGKTFTIVQARRNSGGAGQVTLTLMGGAVRDTLLEGNTKTYTIDGKDYEVTLDFVDDDSAKFTVNGDASRDLQDGETDKVAGVTLGVSEILYQAYAGGVHTATFFLGAQKVYIKDTNINDTASSNEMKVDDETIGGANSWVEGSDDSVTFKLDKIVVNMSAYDDYYVPAGSSLSENPELSEPELLFTKGWDIEYQGLSDEPIEEINIKASGSDDYELEFVDGDGNVATVPLINCVSSNNVRFGDTNDDLHVQENKTITRDDYFVVTDESDTNGERKSYVLRYRKATSIGADTPELTFYNAGAGADFTRPISVGTTQEDGQFKIAEIKLGGGIFRVYNATAAGSGALDSSASGTKDFSIIVDLDGDGSITADGVSINTKGGAFINITNSSSLGIDVEIDTVNSDDYDDKAPSSFIFDLNASSDEVRLALAGRQIHQFLTPDDDDKNTYAYSTYGAFARRSVPTAAPQEVFIEYPENQRIPLVFVSASGTTYTTTGATTEGGAVSIQRIEVGATKLASEVPDINAVNSILVGGPCANRAAADVMGNPADCTEGFEPGVGRIVMYDVGTDNVAMLVAGYAAADTRNACAVISNYGDYELTGEEMTVEKVNNVLTVAEPTAEPEPTTTTTVPEE